MKNIFFGLCKWHLLKVGHKTTHTLVIKKHLVEVKRPPVFYSGPAAVND